MNRFLWLVKCLDVNELRHQVPFGAFIPFSFIIFAVPDQKGSRSESSYALAVAICARFCIFCCLIASLVDFSFLRSGSCWSVLLQSFPKWPNLWQLYYLSSLVAFYLPVFFLLELIGKSAMILVARLLMNFVSADIRICSISSIVLLPRLSILVVVVAKLS